MLAICRYHRNSNGWNDIGYQALVDKYGVLYEGRAGGLDKPVLGRPRPGLQRPEHRHREHRRQHRRSGSRTRRSTRSPTTSAGSSRSTALPLTGHTTLVSAGGATSRYPAGRRVRVPRVLGHRDTNSTACPGSALYYQLDDLRARVATGEALPGVATFLSASLSQLAASPTGGRSRSAARSPSHAGSRRSPASR